MHTNIRRKDRAISEQEALSILEKAEYGVLSTVSENGEPYGVPLNFCVNGKSIYIHCATEGRKLDNLSYNSSVSFCVVGETQVMSGKFGTKYESAIVFGTAAAVDDAEKQIALEGLVAKYSQNFREEGLKYIENLIGKTKVYRIDIQSVTGKARKE
jgi:hypothetical protein